MRAGPRKAADADSTGACRLTGGGAHVRGGRRNGLLAVTARRVVCHKRGRCSRSVPSHGVDAAAAGFIAAAVRLGHRITALKSYQKHLHALAAIARMFTKPETREMMMHADDVSELYELFRQKVVQLKV